MNCSTCSDKGIVKVNWSDVPCDYAVCLCPAGESMRSTVNNSRHVSPRWRVWAAREQVNPETVWMLEDVCTPEELAERGFRELTAANGLDAIAAAAKQKGPKR